MSTSVWSEVRRKVPAYVVFAATGVGLTIPGAVLPLLLREWSMSDARGGVLLSCFYALGSVGSYIAFGRMNRSVARGALLTVAGAVCLAYAGRWTSYGAVGLFGMGVSLTITSISLLMSQRFPAQRRLELTRLNLIWALGAAIGPWLALRSAHGSSVTQAQAIAHAHHVLLGVAGFFALAAVWALSMEDGTAFDPNADAMVAPERQEIQLGGRKGSGIREIPWQLLVLIFGATGVDAAAGGWLTSYAQRAGDSLGITISAATFVWVGALISRVVHSTKWASRWPERRVLGSSLIAMCAALTLLVAWPAGVATMAAAAVLGLAMGPIYPLLIAAALRHRENSTVFAIAGVGASLLPLVTGSLSTWSHSLRAGLVAPLAAAAAMAVIVAMSARIFKGATAAETEAMVL